MRRFLLTSEKFTGTAEVWFNFDGLLCQINLVTCTMDFRQIQYLLQNLSPDVEAFRAMLSGAKLDIKEVAFELSLDDFKREYPYSRNFHLLPGIWSKMSLKEQVLAYFSAIQYRAYCKRNESWNYKPKIAAAWLTKKEYLNDWRKM
jgi:hypothetical protein